MSDMKLLKFMYKSAMESKENLENTLEKCEDLNFKRDVEKNILSLNKIISDCKIKYLEKEITEKDLKKIGPFLNSDINIILSSTDKELANVILQNSIENKVLLDSYLKENNYSDKYLENVCERLINIENSITNTFSKYV